MIRVEDVRRVMEESQVEWHRQHEGLSAEVEWRDHKRASMLGAFLAFMALDARTQRLLRMVMFMSKSVAEAKGLALDILKDALSECRRPVNGRPGDY